MTRILPELYEDNDNFVMNIYSNNENNNSNSMYKKRNSIKIFQIKRQLFKIHLV